MAKVSIIAHVPWVFGNPTWIGPSSRLVIRKISSDPVFTTNLLGNLEQFDQLPINVPHLI